MSSQAAAGNVEARVVRFRLSICVMVLLLAVDEINPVKVVCDIMSVHIRWPAIIAGFMCVFIFFSHISDMVYFMLKTFLKSICQTFFASIEVLGIENIPIHGPIIFVGNHNNQFVDAALIMATNPHQVGFLIAEKSYNKPLIGTLSKMAGSIPVKRPQDYAKEGPGTLCFVGNKVVGKGTNFTKLAETYKLGYLIRPGKSAETYKLINVSSDTECEVAVVKNMPSPLEEKACQGANNYVKWQILPSIQQEDMYTTSYDFMRTGKTLAIFPEGGSHDQTDLLQLKAGFAVIALGTKKAHDINVPIVPIGLNYYKGHRFRQARVVVEYGEPINVSAEQYKNYCNNKRSEAYSDLLAKVEKGLRSVLVTADKYDTLTVIHMARRLYQRNSTVMSTKMKQDLTLRFATAYKILNNSEKGFPEDVKTCQHNIELYQEKLKLWGLKDYQVMNGLNVSFLEMFYHFVHGLTIMVIAAIPTVILNAPVGLAASMYARDEQQKDLAASRVKLAARDVVLSKKVLFSIAVVPMLWCTYGILMLWFRPFGIEARTSIVLLLCFPIFSYIAVTSVTAGLTDWKDMRPALLRLMPSYRGDVPRILKMREDLCKEVRALVRKYGPELGALYSSKVGAGEWDLPNIEKSAETNKEKASDVGGSGGDSRGGDRIVTEEVKDDNGGGSGSKEQESKKKK